MSKKQKKDIIYIGLSTILLIVFSLLQVDGWEKFLLFMIPYALVGWKVLYKAGRNILRGQIFDENFLMAIATVGAIVIGEYNEAVFVMLFYQVGEFFQRLAVGKSRKSIANLMDIRPDYANIQRDGILIQVSPEDVAVGDIILIKAGEKIPLDGVVVEGTSAIDTTALTGESVPRTAVVGDNVISGCVNLSGVLQVKTTKEFGMSTVAKILELVETSSTNKSKSEDFITRFARLYTPIVVVFALLLAVIPPLFDGLWSMWVYRALTFLVISCPCALVISVPLAFFGGIGGASKRGILVKGGNYLEALAQAKTVVFDKTGTLTKGNFVVTAIHPQNISKDALLELTALAECYSDHPISQSLHRAYGKNIDNARVGETQDVAGFGLWTVVDGEKIFVGNQAFMEAQNISIGDCVHSETIIHVANNHDYLGHIVIADQVKDGAKEAISKLRQAGIEKIVMLTGDRKEVGEAVGNALGMDEIRTQLLPIDKVSCVEELFKGINGKLVFVGDGINDAPVLSRADIGIAMGALGSDAAIESADVVLMNDDLGKISEAVHIARKTKRIVTQNVVLALGVKALVLVLGAFGLANMWEAIFSDVGVMLIAVCNAMRAMNYREK